MPRRYLGSYITYNPVEPTTSAASGMWPLNQQFQEISNGTWPNIFGDPYFPYTTLLLSSTALSNANNNLFVDSSGAFNPISRNGNTTQGSFTPYGTYWSNYFDGSGDYLTTPSDAAFGMGTGDFTIECWAYLTAAQANRHITDSSSANFLFLKMTSTTIGVGRSQIAEDTMFNYSFSQGVWYHIAFTRSGSTVRGFVNGVQIGSATNTISYASGPCFIGADGGGTQPFAGYISNLRIVKGTAVYTAAFTPPTDPLTAISGTSLLTCQSNRFRDASSNNFTITRVGDTRVTDYSPFLHTAPIQYNQSDITNWSGYFDGSGDYLQTPSNAAFALSGTSFTIEAWVYVTSSSEAYQHVVKGVGSGGNNLMYIDYTGGSNGVLSSNAGGAPASQSGVTLNTWHHVAVVRNGTSVTCYVNGVGGTPQTLDPGGSGSVSLLVGYDGGTSPARYFNGYMSNLRVVKGTALYTSNFTPPTTNLTAISGTSLLTLQNAAFTDNSTNNFIVTPNGNTTVTGNSPFNTVGYWSNYFDGTGDNLKTPSNAAFAYGTGDFTWEMWVFPTSSTWTGGSSNFYLLDHGSNGGVIQYYANVIRYYNPTTGFGTLYNDGGSIPADAWTHVAVSRQSGTTRLFVNGVLKASASDTHNYGNNVVTVADYGGGGYGFPGYMSNVRIVKGTAVYTASFTPPTTPLTAITNTSLLTCQNNRFIDNSTNAFTLTVAGNTSIQSFDPFYTATIASGGGSAYFDGSDWLNVQPSQLLNFGTNDFTIECWAYMPSTISGQVFMAGWPTGEPVSGWSFAFDGTGFSFTSAVSNAYISSTNTTVPRTGTWYHVAAVRSSGAITVYVNGIGNTPVANTQNIITNTAGMDIGRSPYVANRSWFTGYIANARITKSAVYTSNFTPPTSPVAPLPNTVFMLNGMNAGIYDLTATSDFETVGNAQVRYPSPYAPANYYAGSFDGNGDYLTVPANSAFAFGTGDFTVEAWVYLNAITSTYAKPIVGNSYYSPGTSDRGWALGVSASGNPIFYTFGSTGAGFVLTAPSALTASTWTHVAVSRSGTTIKIFVNGAEVVSGTSGYNEDWTGTTLKIATGEATTLSPSIGNTQFSINGVISNVRIVKGTAVYTSNFTPSTTPLTAISGTSLLTCQNKTFIDNSSNAFTITAAGNSTAGIIGPFTSTGGTSVAFDGSGDWLSVPDSAEMNLGAANFTLEFWVNFNSVAGIVGVIGKRINETVYAPFLMEMYSGELRLYMSTTGGSWQVNGLSTATLSTGQWYHIAVSRSGTTVYMFVNGVSVGSTASLSGSVITNTSPLFIGANSGSPVGAAPVNGYMDDVRITRGYARYTANFTPPITALPTY